MARASRQSGSWNISVTGADKLGEDLAKVAAGIGDWTPCWQRLTPRLLEGIRDIVAGQGGPLGLQWAPLTPGYALEKGGQKKGVSKKKAEKVTATGGYTFSAGKKSFGGLLVRTGALMSRLGIVSMTKRCLRFGVRGLPYAPAMNFGATGQKIPARPFLFTKAGTSAKIVAAFREEAMRFVREVLEMSMQRAA